ncbi:hypothetical protein CRUP_019576 [Coryphaenoides rupestris]|nr:hypothetical protein CRUP_019576 [Coryphaenoides rupestris]
MTNVIPERMSGWASGWASGEAIVEEIGSGKEAPRWLQVLDPRRAQRRCA